MQLCEGTRTSLAQSVPDLAKCKWWRDPGICPRGKCAWGRELLTLSIIMSVPNSTSQSLWSASCIYCLKYVIYSCFNTSGKWHKHIKRERNPELRCFFPTSSGRTFASKSIIIAYHLIYKKRNQIFPKESYRIDLMSHTVRNSHAVQVSHKVWT